MAMPRLVIPLLILTLWKHKNDTLVQAMSIPGSFDLMRDVYSANENTWCQLTDVAVDLFVLQNMAKSEPLQHSSSCVVVVVVVDLDGLAWKASIKFIDGITSWRQGYQFIYLSLAKGSGYYENVTQILDMLVANGVSIHTVVLLAEDQNATLHLLSAVSTFTSLKWTSVIHLTEWIVLSTSSELKNRLNQQQLTIDFITAVLKSDDDSISVVQKSRGGNFNQVFTHKGDGLCAMEAIQPGAVLVYANISNQVRVHPLLYLKQQESIMAGLNIPAGISAKNYTRISSYTYAPNNESVHYGGFTIELLRLMGKVLGFTCNFVMVTDGGGYGEALVNGTVTGITGLLARREAGIAALVSRLPNRAKVIDFLPTILMEETANIVYRLPQAGESLDMTYIQIIQPGFLLSLVGPVILIAIIGALVHVATRECTSPRPRRFTKRDLRSLQTFPQHVFFLADDYAGHTGRILVGTWGIFCVIMWAAYSAYLVTTFATKPSELTINSFQQLVAHSEFRIGMLGSGNALAIIFKTSNDATLQKIWSKVIEGNKTDPLTFSSDLDDHVRRIVAGRYAFIDNFSLASGLFYDFLPPNYTDVRAYPQTSLQGTEASYIAIPKNVFYKDVLYNLHLDLEMAGIILKLQKVHFSNTNEPQSRAKHEGNIVDFGRIEFLVYIVVAAIVVSFICLGVELAMNRRRRQ